MGAFDFLFGSEPEVTVDPTSTFTSNQQDAENTLADFISGIGDPNNVQPFEGDLVAPLSQLEELSLSALEERAMSLGATGGNQLLNTAEQSLIDILTKGPEDIDAFIESNITNPLLKTFNEETRPAISARFADQFFGSNRREADARANEDLQDTLFKGISAAQLQSREFDTNSKLTAAGLAPGVTNAGMKELLELLEAGSVSREVQTSQNLGEFERFNNAKDREAELARIINGFLGIQGLENIVTNDPGSSGILAPALTAAATAFGGPLGTAAATFLL